MKIAAAHIVFVYSEPLMFGFLFSKTFVAWKIILNKLQGHGFGVNLRVYSGCATKNKDNQMELH